MIINDFWGRSKISTEHAPLFNPRSRRRFIGTQQMRFGRAKSNLKASENCQSKSCALNLSLN